MNNYDGNYGLRVEYVEYTVQKGDSLYSISKKFNTNVSELIDINMLTSNTIFPNQVLLVPKKNTNENVGEFEQYTTVNGDTIEGISLKSNTDPVLLGLYNDFGKLILAPGQVMNIPNKTTYIIKNNDTVDSILSNTNRSAEQLLRSNAKTWLKSGTKIYL